MLDLIGIEADLNALEIEATRYGLSKATRDRIATARTVLPIIEAEREKRAAKGSRS